MRDYKARAVIILIGCGMALVLLVVECFLLPSWGLLWAVMAVIVIVAAAFAVHRLLRSRRR